MFFAALPCTQVCQKLCKVPQETKPVSTPTAFIPKGEQCQVIAFCGEADSHMVVAIVLTVFRGAIHNTKQGQRRLRISKPMIAAVPAQYTKMLRVLELEKDPQQPQCWTGSCFSKTFIADPVGSFILDIGGVSWKESKTNIVVSLPAETANLLGQLSGNTIGTFFAELGKDKEERKQRRDVKSVTNGKTPSAVKAASKKLLSADDFDMGQKGRDNIKAFMAGLPNLFAKEQVKLLSAAGKVTFPTNLGKKELSWDEVVLRSPATFHASMDKIGKGKFGVYVAQQLADFLPDRGAMPCLHVFLNILACMPCLHVYMIIYDYIYLYMYIYIYLHI